MQSISKDLKATIADIKEDTKSLPTMSKEVKATIDKVQSQIDFFQLLSIAQNTPQAPLSFLQDDIEDVDIKFNKTNDNEHSCQINLSLKEYGELKVLLISDINNNLNINIGIENSILKTKIQETLKILRAKLISTGLLLQNINIFNINNIQKKDTPYNSSDKLSFGLDIKA